MDKPPTANAPAKLPPPIYLLYSAVGAADLPDSLGRPEYSYFFVREIFRRALERHARVIVIADPVREVDAIVEEYRREGMRCVFLSFAPPHRTLLDVRCPTIPVFAWEFDTLPDEAWDDEPRNDWRWVLAQTGCAITHSEYSARAIRSAMGADFPVVSIPAPLWDRARQACAGQLPRGETTLVVDGIVIDTRATPIAEAAPAVPARKGWAERLRVSIWLLALWYREVIADLLPVALRKWLARVVRAVQARVMPSRSPAPPPPPPAGQAPRCTVRIGADEIVYTSVFNPHDGRKNWQDMVTAFCTTLAAHEDATLILKFVHHDSASALAEARAMLPRFLPHRCRVLILAGFLDDASYRALIARTTFVANSSLSEGQCLPLMEFMSCGKPAVAPRNTAMEEYVDADVAFVVDSSLELCCWPHDSRNVFRAHRYRINWRSLAAAFRDSYRMARHEPARYAAMGARAAARLRDQCCEEVALSRLRQFLHARKDPLQGGPPGPDGCARRSSHG